MFLAAALLAVSQFSVSAAESMIRGTPRTVDQQCSVNFITLAQREVAFPPPPTSRIAFKPLRPKSKLKKQPAAQRQTGTVEPRAVSSRSPAATSSFLALDDDDTAIPPDVGGAVGPNHVMAVHNTQVRIQDRSGNVISTVSLNGFWSSLNSPDVPDCFDPRVHYDSAGARWIMVALCNAATDSSSLLIGVSETSDPTGNWNLFRIDADADNFSFADYPNFGFNKAWIVVTANMFDSFFEDFTGVNVYAFDKAAIYALPAGAAAPPFTLMQDNDLDGFSLAPAVTFDESVTTMYMVEDFDNFNGQLRISTVTGEIGKEVLTLNVAFPTSPEIWGFFGEQAPQLGSSALIDAGDSRMQNAVYRNGALWCTHGIYPFETSLLPTTVQWWQISTGGAVLQRGRIGDLSGQTFYGYPSIAVNSASDCLIGYSRFSATQYVSGNYAFRFGTDPPNTFRADVVLKAGEAPYFKDKGSGVNRWGDYSSTVVDPVNDRDMWTIQQFAATPLSGIDRWGTWWGQVVPAETGEFVTVTASDRTAAEPGTNTAAFTIRRSSPQGDLSVNYVLSGSAVNGTDYQLLPGSVTIPAGSLSAKVFIVAVDNKIIDGTRTVVLTLAAGPGYSVGNPNSARANIADDEILLITSGPTANPNPAITGTTVVLSAVVETPDITGVMWDFGDGTQDQSNRLIVPHGYQQAGDYTVTLFVTHKSGALAIGTTFVTISNDLDEDGIPDVSDPDIDGDGFPNDLEIAFGSDPEDPDSTPSGGAQGGPPKPMKVTRLQARFNFKSFFQDSLQLSGSFPMAAGAVRLSQTLIVDVGGILGKFTLDKNGRGNDGLNTARVSFRKQKLLVPAQEAKFQIKFQKDDFATDLEDEGVTIDVPAKNKLVQIDVLFLFQGTVFQAKVNATYTGEPLKFGTLKLDTKKTAK